MTVLVGLCGLCLIIIGVSSESTIWNGIPIAGLCISIIFLLQWMAFVPASLARTEKFYDLIGSITYTCVILFSLALVGRFDPRSLLLAILVIVWAFRLGWFLYSRGIRSGGDSRFDLIKQKPSRFFMAWTMQGIWILICISPVLVTITGQYETTLSYQDAPGMILAILGFLIEVVADRQKAIHRVKHGKDSFIFSGLWSYSRHPNYVGEILFWTGITLIAFPALKGFNHISLVAPVFVYLLLTRISGTVLLEASGLKKWGEDPLYREYLAKTPLLWPWLK